jgi:citrate synthase
MNVTTRAETPFDIHPKGYSMIVAPPGLRGVVVAKSKMSTVDGERGIFSLCGYDIQELAGKISYEEATYLLWNGDLPNRHQLDEFSQELWRHRELPAGMLDFLRTVPADANPMYVLRSAVSVLGMLTYPALAPQSPGEAAASLRTLAPRLAAQISTLVPVIHRTRSQQSIPAIRSDIPTAAHILYLLHGKVPSAEAAHALDTALMLHCDHGFNNSTFTARVVASSLTDPYSAIVAAIGSLNGVLHGGANAHVLPMLQEIGKVENVESWVHGQLDQKRKIMGIGHAVYKTMDPRKEPLKRVALKLMGTSENATLIRIAEQIEKTMYEAKGLPANVDLFSAPTFHTLGFAPDLFTPLFVVSRCVGWIGQIIEQLDDNKIFRPECEYVGPAYGRKFLPIDKRG